jgi:hypothetical protein
MSYPDHLENEEDSYYEEKSMEELDNMVPYEGTEFKALIKYGADMLAGEHKTVIVVKSAHSGMQRIHRLDVHLDIFENRIKCVSANNMRPFIQDLFPELTSEQREALMTGISDSEWNELYPKEEETV